MSTDAQTHTLQVISHPLVMSLPAIDYRGGTQRLHDDVMTIMPMVQSANAMAEDMDRTAEFSMLLVSPLARGLESGKTEVGTPLALIIAKSWL